MSRARVRAYGELVEHQRRITMAATAKDVLDWDELTGLADRGAEYRGEQIAFLAGLHHDLQTDPRLHDWLGEIEGSELVQDPGSAAAANVRAARRQYARRLRIPRSLVQELALTVSVAQREWKLARLHDDFERFAPWLERVLALQRDQARCLADGDDLYAPLLAEYEPGIDAEAVGALLRRLGDELSRLLPEVLSAQGRAAAAATPDHLRGSFAESRQRKLCSALLASVGFDLTRGRVGTAAHPFTVQLGPHDCRIAVRFDRRNLREAFTALMHEAGHGLYDQGLPVEHYGTPAGEAASLSVHESQARLWENAVGRSLGFWRRVHPLVAELFPRAFPAGSTEATWRALNRVNPGSSRVQADEVTYNLHILLRYELERALLGGDLEVGDLPAAWRARHRELLGVEPASDREGCLQDGHWAEGMIAYFPTYALGNVLAAQLFARARGDLGDLEERFAAGDFASLREWLREHVYRHGQRFDTEELCRRVCGTGLDPKPLLESLRRRHAELWV
jgi:carboxypeptidase Taq